ncbi:putative NAD dependent epimerase/dehydratase [Nemania sp. NC0429]|nr:putative NAD dependent epimerase/dehydratase [Nemania sp. NC0429]
MSAPKQQRIFVTGATGYIGSRVTEFALAQGYAVHGLSRSESGTAKLRSLGAVPVEGDLSSLDLLRAEAAQADAVIHLADAWIDDFSQPYDNVVKIDAAAVDAMATGLAQSGSERKLFLGTSGIGVVEPEAGGGETDESAPANKSPLNGRIRCERHVLSKADEDGSGSGSGIRVVVMRLPPFVYGRGGSGVRLFLGIFSKLGFVVRVSDGRTRTSVVHVDDAARAYVFALGRAGNDDAASRARDIYNVASSTEVDFRAFTDAMAATLGFPVRELSTAEAAGTAGPLVAGFFSDRVRGNSDKLRRELGWSPVEEGIVEDIRTGSYVEVARTLKSTARA